MMTGLRGTAIVMAGAIGLAVCVIKGTGPVGAASREATQCSRTSFFKAASKQKEPLPIMAYATFPKDLATVRVPGMANSVHWLAQRLLREPPSREFIARNIACVAHGEFKKRGRSEDVVFLRYRSGENDVMLVWSGGTFGQVYVFVCPHEAEISASHAIRPVNVVRDVTLYQQGPALAQEFSGKALSVRFTGGLPARGYARDQWFEVVEEKAMPREEAGPRPGDAR